MPATVLEYSSVIVGAGPVGLLATLAALKHASDKDVVALLADRLDELGIRQQVLWIQQDVYDFIKKLVGDELMEQYKRELAITDDEDADEENPQKEHGYYITTGDLERLAHAALLDQYEQGVDFDIIDTKKITGADQINDVIQINKAAKTLSVKAEGINDKKDGAAHDITLKFKYLAVADGAKRSIAKALGDKELFFDHTQKALAHKRHVVATFNIPEGTTPKTCSNLKVHVSDKTGVAEPVVVPPQNDIPKRVINPCSLAELRAYGWKGNTRPHSQIYATRDVIYIGAEIPEGLSKEKAQEYAKLLMRDQLPEDYLQGITEVECDLETAYGRKRAQLKTSVFDIELGDLNKTLVPCGNLNDLKDVGAIFFMGDTRKNPLYTTGTGAQTGVREVRNFEQFMADRKKATHTIAHDMEKFHAHSRALLDEIVDKQNKWIDGRVGKEKAANTNYTAFTKYHAHIAKVKDLVDAFLKDAKSLPMSESIDFVAFMKKEFTNLQTKHKKVLACCEGEFNITCYNGVNVDEFFHDIDTIRSKMLKKYPSAEKLQNVTPVGNHDFVTDFYENIKNVMINVAKPSPVVDAGFFSQAKDPMRHVEKTDAPAQNTREY